MAENLKVLYEGKWLDFSEFNVNEIPQSMIDEAKAKGIIPQDAKIVYFESYDAIYAGYDDGVSTYPDGLNPDVQHRDYNGFAYNGDSDPDAWVWENGYEEKYDLTSPREHAPERLKSKYDARIRCFR